MKRLIIALSILLLIGLSYDAIAGGKGGKGKDGKNGKGKDGKGNKGKGKGKKGKNPVIPIDGGLIFLAAAAVVYGGRKIIQQNKRDQ